MQLLRQPSIVGYILSGIVLSPQLNNLIQNQESVQLFAYLGIVMLLFLVGL
jgi:Kef-type K+ transport system membrane component KefB